MYPLAEDMSKNRGPNSRKYSAPMYPLVEDMSKIYARPLPRVYAIFLFAIERSAKADYSMPNKEIAYTLGRGRAYISDMSSTSGYMGATCFQEFDLGFFEMSN